MKKVGFIIAGVKGLEFFEQLKKHVETTFVCSYQPKGTLDNSLDKIMTTCAKDGHLFVHRKLFDSEILKKADLVFVVGWQYMLSQTDDRFVIFHDSLLPRYRGFSPTVSALINGEYEIGVTGLRPSSQVDRGPIYAQAAIKISYPIKLKDALHLLKECYQKVALEILDKFEKNILSPILQNEAQATYSIWRDEFDYFVDWNWPAKKIVRFVDSVGWPYSGARTFYKDEIIVLDEVEEIDDIYFEDRHIGKTWALENGIPVVISGEGLLRVLSARKLSGELVSFSLLRSRFGLVKNVP
jgi:methionyl-tRNA formyltransferase